MTTDVLQTTVDLSERQDRLTCERMCGRPAIYITKGCMDKQPVLLCDECYTRGVQVIIMYLRMYQRTNKRVLICGDCHRPVLTLDTHLEVKYLP